MKRKRKNSIITTLALICAIIMITLLPLPIAEAANFTVSKSNVSIENGKSSTITIKAPTHTGRIDIVSSNSNVATVSDSSLWVENNSKTITISAKSVGSATITIKGELYDESIGEEAEYSRTINVTVTKAANSSNTDTAGNNANGSTGGSNSSGSTSGSNAGASTGSGNTGSSTGGTQSSGTSGGTSNNNQSSNNGASSSSGQSSAKPVQSTTNVNASPSAEQTATIEENNEEQITNEAENLIEEIESEEVLEELAENIIEEETEQLQSANIKESTSSNSKGKMIIIAVIGVIALIMIFLGIGISKNIFKK